MSYHHRIDPAPVPKKVTYFNETWIADSTIQPQIEDKYQPEDLVDASADNIRVYVPLDISYTAVLRRLRSIIHKYGEANEGNEFAFESEVCSLISQIEIYDQIHYVRSGAEGMHSEEACGLVREFVTQLKEIPDGCAELFPFELIDELEEEYGI